MHVVLTCDWLVKYAVSQSIGLVTAGARVTLVVRDHAEEFGGRTAEWTAALERAHDAGVRVLVLPGRQSDVRRVRGLARLRRAIVATRPDIVHAHDNADFRALAVLAGRPTVVTLHDPTLHPGQIVPTWYKRPFSDGGRKAWLARARTIIVHSEELKAEARVRRGQRLRVVPHGVDVLDEPLPPPAEPTVGFFGRMEPYKGLEILAAAMPRVWEARPEVRVLLAGQGPTRFPLADSRVEERRGYLPEAAVRDFFAECSLVVLPYTQASQSGAGSLAIGAGVPVVVSRVGGLPDLALDPTWTVPPGDRDALALALVRGLDAGPHTRRAVLDRVASPRSWASAGRLTLDVYREVLASG